MRSLLYRLRALAFRLYATKLLCSLGCTLFACASNTSVFFMGIPLRVDEGGWDSALATRSAFGAFFCLFRNKFTSHKLLFVQGFDGS